MPVTGHERLPLAELIACVDRELSMRRKTYPRWVAQKKLTQAGADQELARMLAVRDRLLEAEALDAVLGEVTTDTYADLSERLSLHLFRLRTEHPYTVAP